MMGTCSNLERRFTHVIFKGCALEYDIPPQEGLQGPASLTQLLRASACSRSRPMELLHLISIQSACAKTTLTGLVRRSFLAEYNEARP